MTFKRYPSTEQFRNVVTSVKQWASKMGKPIPHSDLLRHCQSAWHQWWRRLRLDY